MNVEKIITQRTQTSNTVEGLAVRLEFYGIIFRTKCTFLFDANCCANSKHLFVNRHSLRDIESHQVGVYDGTGENELQLVSKSTNLDTDETTKCPYAEYFP